MRHFLLFLSCFSFLFFGDIFGQAQTLDSKDTSGIKKYYFISRQDGVMLSYQRDSTSKAMISDSVTYLENLIATVQGTPGPQGVKGDKGDPGTNGTNATVPTNVSAFTNDAGYVGSAALSAYATTSALTSGLAGKFNTPSGTTAQYLRGDGTPATFPTIPTNNNQLTNGAGYITGIIGAQVAAALGYTPLQTEADGSVTNEIQALSISSSTITLSNGGGNITIPVYNGSETIIANTGTNTTVTGAGTTANPYVINSTAPNIVYLANITVGETAAVAINAGVRKVTITGVTGALTADRIMLTPIGATPAGYALADVVCTANGTLQVSLTAPLLALGASYSIPCKVTVFR